MQKQIAIDITIDVAENNAKKLSGRLLTIKLAVEKLNHYRDNDRPSRMSVRVEELSKIDNLEFVSKLTKNPWE
jgi:hypothetical protein